MKNWSLFSFGRFYSFFIILILNSKLDHFPVSKTNFRQDFWILHPKIDKDANFHGDNPNRTQIITNLLLAENSKWQTFEENAQKQPKFQNSMSQNPIGIGQKNLAGFCFPLVGTFD